MIRLEERAAPSRVAAILSPVLAVALTVSAGFVLFAAIGHDPGEALFHFFLSPLLSSYSLAELAVKATPLVLCAVGLSVGFRAGVWNIGAEGQLLAGALAGGGVALAFWGDENPIALPLMLLAGVAGGMAWAAVPAFLKTRFDVNEILTSLMLTYVAGLLLQMLIQGPWRDPDGFNFPQSRLLADTETLRVLVAGTRLHVGAVFALVAALGASLMLDRTLVGFAVKVTGLAPAAARFAGFGTERVTWFCLLLSGGLAGLAGIVEVAGPVGQLVPNLSPGYGFTAIIVAFLGRLHPLGIVLAGLVMALSYVGGEMAQVAARLPQAVTGVFQGMLLFFLLACDVLVRYRIRRVGPRPSTPARVRPR